MPLSSGQCDICIAIQSQLILCSVFPFLAQLTHIGSTITQSGQNSSPRRLAATFGRKEVLVLRESRSAYSEAVMSDEIFGTYGDLINLTSQYAACSYSQLTFSKWTGNDLVNEGVLTVSISTKIIRAEEPSIRDAMTNEAIAILGARLEDLVDHVMVCIPEGTRGTWIAYAYIDFWLSGKNSFASKTLLLLLYLGPHSVCAPFGSLQREMVSFSLSSTARTR